MHVNSRIVKMGVQSNMFLRTNSKVRLKLRVTTYVWLCFVVICANMCPVTHGSGDDVVTFNVDEEYHTVTQSIPQQLTQLQGGRVSDRTVRLTKEKSPYLLREDLIIEPSGELVVDPDVEIRFSPMVGLTVKGVLSAKGIPEAPVIFTSSLEPEITQDIPPVRLIDGPNILTGRLQVYHLGNWRSVCTNSRNWTRADIDVVCRHLGFQGGEWWNWLDRVPGHDPRVLLEEPKCRGTESTLHECDWNSRQMGSGVCDYHPDIGIQCLPKHVSSLKIVKHWRGINFENAKSNRIIIQHNTYIERSLSELVNTEIRFAGSGRNYAAVSAIQVDGVPPQMINSSILHSAYNGVNVSIPNAPIIFNNCTFRNNRGYGVYMNSSSGMAYLDGCTVTENGGDGVKYVHHDERIEERLNRKDLFDFCTIPTTGRQSYPLFLTVEQDRLKRYEKDCSQSFFTQNDQVITVHFISMTTDQNDTGVLEIYDGISSNEPILTKINFRNGTKPQSVRSSRNNVFIRFVAKPQVQLFGYFKITSGYHKTYDLNITSSSVSDNNGRGVTVENIRSQLHVHQSSISNNHVAGINLIHGAGDLNVSDSRIAFNNGDGINITYTGGNRNITRTSLSSNKGYGVAVWFNDSIHDPYLELNQSTIISYSEIFKNYEIGVIVGNFCRNSFVNISGNWFNDSRETDIDISSCWRSNAGVLHLQIGHNTFMHNEKLGIKIQPALNLYGKIEFNRFKDQLYGCILVKNGLLEEFETLPVTLFVENNYFDSNHGVYVVNLGLSPYSEVQKLLFTKNFVKDNRIREPFDVEEGEGHKLIPRSRVAAPVVISSSNVDIYRNIIHNPESNYEVGSHLEDQSKIINCTYNWLGFQTEKEIYPRIFDRKDRYNLAKITFLPFLLHSSNPSATIISLHQPQHVPQFIEPGSNRVGGEVDGMESLKPGEYIVQRDINIQPGGRLILQPGVTLRFPSSVGIMVAGYIEARGSGRNNIHLTLQEEQVLEVSENDTTEILPIESQIPVRLLGGLTSKEGRLQVRIGSSWGTVCNYGWTLRDAALACHQLGLVLNPGDWFLERSEIPAAGANEDIILSNVRCTDEDVDITKCRAEHIGEFENSCTHENDVGLRCYESSWAGMRLSVLAERSDLQYITIEKAGLLDYATNAFKPALQIDFSRHALEAIRVVDNLQDGLGIVYSDLFSRDVANTVKNSEFSNNRGSGISFKQLGLKISGSRIENNKRAGIRHNPALSSQQQRELAGWFTPSGDLANVQDAPYKPIFIPHHFTRFDVEDKTLYLVTSRVKGDSLNREYYVKCQPGYVIGIQLLNPIHNRSTEEIIIYDSLTINPLSQQWNLSQDLVVFPVVSSSYGIVIGYSSGFDALGGTVIVLSSYPAPLQNVKNRIVRGPVPTLVVSNSQIKGNKYGIWASYFNRYLNELGDHFLRKSNESVQVIDCHISHNTEEAILVNSPYWDIYHSNLSEVTFMINRTNIVENKRGIRQFSRDLRSSNNLYHWVLQDNTIELNKGGGFDISLPYVWQYNENFTHSLYFDNNTWRNNQQFSFIVDGHFAQLNMTNNIFVDNHCKTGLISVRGMEKKMKIMRNRVEGNIGTYMVEFTADSQSEILGEVQARFLLNEVKRNKDNSLSYKSVYQTSGTPSYVLGFRGIQKVDVNHNLFGNNSMQYELLAGIRTAKIDNYVNVEENWWGTSDVTVIKRRLFDFDDWNNHAIARFRPYLMEDSFESSISTTREQPSPVDFEYLGGRIRDPLTLYARDRPYIVQSDITVMPGVTLTIAPEVIMEFPPNVGILVLGALKAQGAPGREIIMRPLSSRANVEATNPHTSAILQGQGSESIRLCTGGNCTSSNMELDSAMINEGFLEYFNSTTMQWVPICDDRFTERNAQVVCRELGFEYINVYFDHGVRVEFHPNSLSRIWSWPDPWQCKGDENKLEECAIRLNGQLYGHRHKCSWNSNYVFIHCGPRNLEPHQEYWGGIRFADGEFEQNLYEHRIHDVVTHQTAHRAESSLEYVNITGAGVLHNEKSPAIQSINRSPTILRVNITNCASHGMNFISPIDTTRLMYNSIEHTLGVGISALSLTGEGRESEESSYTPLRQIHIPYHLFSLVDMCDPAKEITIEERVLVYYKYDNHPVNCIKIFNSVYDSKPLGFRLLQFNLFNSTGKVGQPDSITLYDGDIYNITSKIIGNIKVGNNMEKRLFRSILPSLSIKLFANGASEMHGFIAEVVTLPISAIGFNRDVQHNISYSIMTNNRQGAIHYGSAGEVNPMITVEWNQFKNNCDKLYGNFTTCGAAVYLDIQNTRTVYFRNNLVDSNQGGLAIRADSRGSATALKGWLHNNLFTDNSHNPALYIEGRQSSPYQEVTIYRNYFTRNIAPYEDIIILKQVVSNFTYNYVHHNFGHHILEVSGFERVRLPIYQTTSHNGFYWNYATDRDSRSTVIAGTAGQHYVDNVFYDPENDYEIVTVNRSFAGINSSLDVWKTPIDAKHNWWGYNETLAVMGRIRDRSDHPDLLEVDFKPFHMNNQSILSGGKCPPGWMLVGDTCYIYVGAPMAFEDARTFCRSVNASMPYVMGNYLQLYHFLRHQQETYQFYDHVWVQHIDKINKCTMFAFQKIEIDHCQRLNPFLCEIDPKVHIDPLSWRDDILTVVVLIMVGIAILLIAVAAGFWYTKSRHRHAERLERRNSIRQSLRSVRSVGLASSHGAFSDLAHRQKTNTGQRSSPTITKGMDYKKMMNGSIDSMDKSQFNSSVEDTHSYDIYEAHNPNTSARTFNYTSEFPGATEAVNPSFDLAYKNEGFRDHSAYTSRDNWHSTTGSEYDDESPGTIDYNSSTLPLDASFAATDSTLEMKQGIDYDNQQAGFKPRADGLLRSAYPPPPPPADEETYPLAPSPPSNYHFEPSRTNLLDTSLDNEPLRPQSHMLLETNLDDDPPPPPSRSKSEALLETNLDLYGPTHQVSNFSRSKSQPLETAM